jgi:hypothetical protein
MDSSICAAGLCHLRQFFTSCLCASVPGPIIFWGQAIRLRVRSGWRTQAMAIAGRVHHPIFLYQHTGLRRPGRLSSGAGHHALVVAFPRQDLVRSPGSPSFGLYYVQCNASPVSLLSPLSPLKYSRSVG